LKNYLDDRLHTAIRDYRKATEPDLFKVKADIMQADDHLQEVKRLESQVAKLRMVFEG